MALDRYRRVRALVSRQNPNECIEYVLRDEVTQKPVRQATHHERIQQAFSEDSRVNVWSHVGAGKTQQAIGRLLFEIGNNPLQRWLIASRGVTQSSKIIRQVRQYIEQSVELREVFPNLKPGEPWTDNQITIQRPGRLKDPTLRAIGTDTTSVLGTRADGALLDDVLSWDNTATPRQREKLWDWYHTNIVSRLEPGSRVWVIGTAFHPEDLMHRLAKLKSFVHYKFPVIDSATGKPMWEEKWDYARIEERRNETTPHEFARTMLCTPLDDARARFKREWINQCLKRGEGKKSAFALKVVPLGYRVYTGVDLGHRTKKTSDETVLFTIIIHPNEDREILCIEAGRWTGGDIVDKIIDTYNRFLSMMVVENNAAQQFILDFTKKRSAVPVIPFTTGRNKMHPEFGIEGLAAEMANSKWIIPSTGGVPANAQIAAFIEEMLYYDPRSHTGDRLMAAWFAKEAARVKPKRAGRGRIDLLSR